MSKSPYMSIHKSAYSMGKSTAIHANGHNGLPCEAVDINDDYIRYSAATYLLASIWMYSLTLVRKLKQYIWAHRKVRAKFSKM